MSLIADAVNKAGSEKEAARLSARMAGKASRSSFLTALAVFFLTGAVAAGIYFYEESRIEDLKRDLAAAQAPVAALRSENEALRREKTAVTAQFAEETKKNLQKIDDLLGKDKVLQYQSETIEADNAAKEKKIAELEAQIEKQGQKEESLMALIEEAKKQLAAKPAVVAAASAAVVAVPGASASQPAPTQDSSAAMPASSSAKA